ncbi:hypothetical protein WJX74_002200 [Apatococcus lobatus]|uniref:Uncharacterized protein n=1 Tax=Apatococcus lobatus TaxID=904363 RepID=A0AAW1S6X7_9CHLO
MQSFRGPVLATCSTPFSSSQGCFGSSAGAGDKPRALAAFAHTRLARRRPGPIRASHHVFDLAASDPGSLQTVVVGAALRVQTDGIGEMLYIGIMIHKLTEVVRVLRKGEPKVCDLCQGTGGTRCFGCGASGRMPQLAQDQPQKKPKRDLIGRRPADPTVCRVCKGTGLVMCSKCKGSGYLSGM